MAPVCAALLLTHACAPQQPDDDLAAIDELRQALVVALGAADEVALNSYFTDDAVIIDPGSSSPTKRRAEERFLDTAFFFGPIEVTITPAETTVQGDLAYEWGSASSPMWIPDSKYDAHYLAVLRREAGQWKVARFAFKYPLE